jgi:large subunit ribosomal protein L3
MAVRGLIGKKIGTTQVFTETGDAECVTAVSVGPCTVTQVKSIEKDGYERVQLGYENVRRLNKPRSGQLRASGGLFRYLREVEAEDVEEIEVGQQVDVGLFQQGDEVDAIGFSKGRGFAGGVKRHGFHGGPKTHGQSDRHRAPGSIGAGTTPGRVLKGHKMAGHMGNSRVTVRHLKVMEADADRNLLLLKGAVPGAQNSLLIIRRSRRTRSK